MLDIVAAVMLASAAGQAVQPAATAGQAAATPNPDIVVRGEKAKERRLVCRTETPTGSSFPKRICRTAAQIEQERAEGSKLMEDASRIQALQVRRDSSDSPK
jgi:hypothetical protein